MNKRRLLKLAGMLEADAKNPKGLQFDLGCVGQQVDSYFDEFKPALDCGTTACAMGLAAISGAFKRAGLSYKLVRGYEIDCTINGRSQPYDRAAMKVFDLSQEEADFLFTPFHYYGADFVLHGARGERGVAKRIRDFVAGKVGPS